MANKPLFAIGVDAGSGATRCLICVIENGRLRYAGHGSLDSIGWNKGRIADAEAVSTCMRAAVQAAESIAGLSADSVVAGIGGSSIAGFENRSVYEFGRRREITQEDVSYVVDRAARMPLLDDRCLLHVFPQDFTLDGRAGYRNPRGANGARLEAHAHLVTASSQEHEALISAVQRAHFSVEETVFEAVAGAYASIVNEDRNRGVAIIDIGLHSTEVAVYDGDALMMSRSLPICGDHFTRDVAFGLKVSYDDAERLKTEYGCAIIGLTADNSIIEVPSAEGRPAREAPRLVLNDILEARAEQLFTLLQKELIAADLEGRLLEGVVLTGGGARLNGMCDMAERVLNCPARNGLPLGIERLPEELEDPAWTTAAGLAMYSARLKTKRDGKKKAPGLAGLIHR